MGKKSGKKKNKASAVQGGHESFTSFHANSTDVAVNRFIDAIEEADTLEIQPPEVLNVIDVKIPQGVKNFTIADIAKNALEHKPTGFTVPSSYTSPIKPDSVKIKGEIIAIRHYKNGAWGYYNYYEIVDAQGNLYKHDLGQGSLDIRKVSLDEFRVSMKDVYVDKVGTVDAKLLTKIQEEVSTIETDEHTFDSENYLSTGHCMMDAGVTAYFILDERLSNRCSLICLRGDMDFSLKGDKFESLGDDLAIIFGSRHNTRK